MGNLSGLFDLIPKAERAEKGRSILELPADFVVVDLETTGLMPACDFILEFGAIRVRSGQAVAKFQTFAKSFEGQTVDEFITELTGITSEMIQNAPPISEALPAFLEFVGADIVVGHNVNFDINFIYDECMARTGKPFVNNFVDTLRLSRRVHPEERHHRLADLADRYGIQATGSHRAVADCETTLECYRIISGEITEKFGSVEGLKKSYEKTKLKADSITGDASKADPSSPFYGKVCVVTGKLERFTRAEVMQLIADIGGVNADGVTKKTNYLILGNLDYAPLVKSGKSNKQKRAEQLQLDGYDIEVIPEDAFYEMITSE